MLRSFFTACIYTLLVTATNAQQYTPIDNGSAVNFAIKNFAVNTNGSFTGLKGSIFFNESDLAASRFEVSVDVTTINTGIKSRDTHLKKEDYFNTEKFPVMSFVSKQVMAGDKPGNYTIKGSITIKGITMEVSFPFTVSRKGDGLLFNGIFKLNRRDFKVGGSSLVLSDNLIVSLSLFAKRN